MVQYLGTGRRKTSVARVFLRPGKGEIKVNNRAVRELFPHGKLARHGAAAAGGHRNHGQVRSPDSRRWRRRRRPGGRRPSGHFPGIGGVQRGTAVPAEEARLPHPRSRAPTSARSTAKRALASGSSSPNVRVSAKPEGCSIAVPPFGLCRLLFFGPVSGPYLEAFRSLPRRKSRFGPRAASGTMKEGCSVAGASLP